MNMSMVTVFLNPDGGVVFAILSMVTVSLNPDGGVAMPHLTACGFSCLKISRRSAFPSAYLALEINIASKIRQMLH